MKNTPPGKGAACDAGDDVLVSDTATFRIINATTVDYGAKKAELRVEIDGVGILFVDVFNPQDRAPFVAPRSIRSKFSGSWERTFKLDDALATEIVNAFFDREETR